MASSGIDIDADFPELSAIAGREGYSLQRLAKEAVGHDSHLRLNDCCSMAISGFRHSHADARNYLATLNEFVKRISHDPKAQLTLWRRLTSKKLYNGSTLLDTVAEAAWAIHFIDKGYEVELDKKFDPLDPDSKNADIFVTIDGKQFWFDIVNIEPKHLTTKIPLVSGSPIPGVYNMLGQAAVKKYKSKFKKAVLAGLLPNASVGILLCYIKVEHRIIPHILTISRYIDFSWSPPNIFSDDTVGLDYVYVYSMFYPKENDCLQPSILFEWSRSLANKEQPSV